MCTFSDFVFPMLQIAIFLFGVLVGTYLIRASKKSENKDG